MLVPLSRQNRRCRRARRGCRGGRGGLVAGGNADRGPANAVDGVEPPEGEDIREGGALVRGQEHDDEDEAGGAEEVGDGSNDDLAAVAEEEEGTHHDGESEVVWCSTLVLHERERERLADIRIRIQLEKPYPYLIVFDNRLSESIFESVGCKKKRHPNSHG